MKNFIPFTTKNDYYKFLAVLVPFFAIFNLSIRIDESVEVIHFGQSKNASAILE